MTENTSFEGERQAIEQLLREAIGRLEETARGLERQGQHEQAADLRNLLDTVRKDVLSAPISGNPLPGRMEQPLLDTN